MKLSMASVLDFYGVACHPGRTQQKVLCPVHGENDPSCNVNMDEGVWYCHSCGEGGSAIDLVMKLEGLDYESARTFASDSGIESAESDGGVGGLQLGLVARKRLPGAKRDQRQKRGYVPPWRR